jgi:hypothetical protein
MRLNECEQVKETLGKHLGIKLTVVDGAELFLSRLKGVAEPEKKRKIIGGTCMFTSLNPYQHSSRVSRRFNLKNSYRSFSKRSDPDRTGSREYTKRRSGCLVLARHSMYSSTSLGLC